MTILMTGLCEKGADQIWKQCNDAMYARGVLGWKRRHMRAMQKHGSF
ncbi:MAG: hypothetical protein ACLR8P_10770 [Clostridium fessum]